MDRMSQSILGAMRLAKSPLASIAREKVILDEIRLIAVVVLQDTPSLGNNRSKASNGTIIIRRFN